MLAHKETQLGFGLIEVMISVLIISIGLLGVISLQSNSIKSLQEGDNLVTASMIAKEMAQRMLSNRYVLAQGRQGYLATELNNSIENAGGVSAWISNMQNNNPDISSCYLSDCFAGASYNSANHIQALFNMQLLDEIEMRSLAWEVLPQGQIKICFDSSGAYNSWACDNIANRIEARNENIFTIKVGWQNIFDNSLQIYTLQFTAECSDNDSAYCG